MSKLAKVKKQKFYLSPQQKEIAVNILSALALGTILAIAVVAPNAVQIFKIFSGKKEKFKKIDNYKKTWTTLQKLSNDKQIRFSKKNDRNIIEITENGHKELLKYNLEKMILNKSKKWDGWWHVVTFDIPEENKNARDAFRSLLKRLDFHKLQKSVFITPYKCKKEINYIKEVYEIRNYVIYFKAKEINNEFMLKEKFSIV